MDRSPRIYLAVKFHPDQTNRDLIETLSRIIETAGYQPVCVARDLEEWGKVHFDPQELMERSFELMLRSRFVCIDLTEKGVGLGIEAGFAFARGIPIIVVLLREADLSNTLAGIAAHVVRYQDPQDLAPFFKSLT